MVEVHEISTESHENINGEEKKACRFCINDNMDVLIEILKRLDERSIGVAACVCRLWRGLTRNDSLWEHLCFRHLSPPPEGVRTVVVALGGYRRLYTVCVKPVLSRLGRMGGAAERRVWTRHEVELSLSLFCVDYYERLFLGSGAGGRLGADGGGAASSLMFLCKAVNSRSSVNCERDGKERGKKKRNGSSSLAQSRCSLWCSGSWVGHLWRPWFQAQEPLLQGGVAHCISVSFSSHSSFACCPFNHPPQYFWRTFDYWDSCIFRDVSFRFLVLFLCTALFSSSIYSCCVSKLKGRERID